MKFPYWIFLLPLIAWAGCSDDGGGGGGDGDTDSDTDVDTDSDSDSDTDTDSDTDSDSDTDIDTDTEYPKLFVADDDGVRIWSGINQIAADQDADATLTGTSGAALGLALYDDRLFVAGDDATSPVLIYDDASTLGDSAANDETIGAAAFGTDAPLANVYEMFADADGSLWIDYGSIRLFSDAASLDSASSSTARFTHEWGPQIYSMAYDGAGNKLIGGQVSNAGLIVWDDPTNASGEDNPPDWTLFPGTTPSALSLADDRLYAANTSGTEPFVRIWDDISSTSVATDPDTTMGTGSGLGNLSHLLVRFDRLFATINDPPSYQIAVFDDASGIAGDVAADNSYDSTAMILPAKTFVDVHGNMYVIEETGIVIFGAVNTDSPYWKVKLDEDVVSPNDIFVMECSPTKDCGGSMTCVNGQCVP